jgi:BirA family biotin operon repressor/biotin-[acetyl-CoA-carboxylase] ligase
MNRLLKGLGTQVVGQTAYTYGSVGSTNDVARRLAEQGTPEGTLVLAEVQTAGRGRMGRRWEAPAGSSLLFSLVFYPQLEPQQTHRLTMCCALGVAEAILETTGLPATLKWPNDVLVHGRKVAGILTETGLTGDRLDWAIVGIGINVNFSRHVLERLAPGASTLASEAGHKVSRRQLLHALLKRIETHLLDLNRPDLLVEAWRSCLSTLGRRVAVAGAEGVTRGLAEAVDRDGALLIRDDVGRVHRFLAGDVTILPTVEAST